MRVTLPPALTLSAQVLPVNDTSVHGTWRDSYPYSSLSVFALHPLYLSLPALLQGSPPGAAVSAFAADIESARATLDGARHNGTHADVDYEGTMAAKLGIARRIFDALGAERCAPPFPPRPF